MTPDERASKLVTIESDDARDCHTLWLAGMMRLFTVYQGVNGKTARETAEIYREGFVRLLRDAVRDAVAEEREACAVAVCPHCAAGNRPFLVEGVLVHAFFRGDREERGGCLAEAIRARPSA